jgi:UDP-2,4-diacetamido-2,4,6-trideoxy-beta-L-altropyranose hydrolase
MRTPEFILRRVVPEDIKLLFHWANDEQVRESAIAADKISFETHTTWLNKKINSAPCGFFILEKDSEPVGQIRFDYNEVERAWEIDYSVAKEYRGMGLGKALLRESINSLNYFPLVAYVKVNNKRSQGVFTSLGFINSGLCTVRNNTLMKFYKELIP